MLNPDQSTTGTPGRRIAPVFDDPVLLRKFADFLRAFANRYDGVKRRGWWDGRKDKNGCGFTLEECIENGKPTWVDLGRGGASGLRMVQENRELIERFTNRIGYHFHLQRASYPRRAEQGVFDLELTWINQGVAPIYIPCAVAIALLDESGKRVATAWPQECNPHKWMPDQSVVEKTRVECPDVSAGMYRLALALTRANGDATPYIRLGTDLPTMEGCYVLGKVEIAR